MLERLDDARESAEQVAVSHLGVLRALLSRDYLRRPHLRDTLRDLAEMVRESLDAREAMVALLEPASGTWSAMTSMGVYLEQEEISAHGSRSVLERVRQTEQSVLTTEEAPFDIDSFASESVLSVGMNGVLAVPLFGWELQAKESHCHTFLMGCVYAHRVFGDADFSADDVALVLDITRIAQPTLNVLRELDGVERALEASRHELATVREQVAHRFRLGAYESRDPWFAEHVLGVLHQVSHAHRIGLCLQGPTGSGKSHLARCYHYACARSEGPFVVFDCSQVTSSETLAAELFGYAARSGYANAPPEGRPGKAQLADGGTLFLDEIGSLPAELQQRLLRLIEVGSFAPLGGSKERRVDIQIIAATLEPLPELVQRKLFREDLFWRLNEVTIHLPSLDERAADIPLLARQFVEQACERYKRAPLALTDDALGVLQRYPWGRAGNIRGLAHAINRSVLMATPQHTALDAADLKLHQLQEIEPREAPPPGCQPQARGEGAGQGPTGADGRSSAQPWPDASDDAGEATETLEGILSPEEQVLRELLAAKIHAHQGVLAAVAADVEVAAALGYVERPLPGSTLRLRIQQLQLKEILAASRKRHQPKAVSLDVICEGIRAHGSASAAARALGISRDALMWTLRKAGLTVKKVRARQVDTTS